MHRRLTLLVAALAALGAGAGLWLVPHTSEPPVVSLTAVYDPYNIPPLRPYGAFRRAVASGDLVTLQQLADEGDGYLAYRAALEVARWATVDATTRLAYYQRALALRVDDPLARAERVSLDLEVADAAVAAGATDVAVSHYSDALPATRAADGLRSIEHDPYRLANAFLRARMYRSALDALDGLSAPSIEAPSHRALGEYDQALRSYQAWLDQQPDSTEARFGRAWTLFYLGRTSEAGAAFGALAGEDALYGRALVANRQGDVDTAVALLARTHDADWLWLATGLLEARDRFAEAVPLYLRIARGGTVLADDAAYRAYVLAERLGDDVTAATAKALVPDDSFFALKLGRSLDVPRPSADLPEPAAGRSGDGAAPRPVALDLPPLQLARALVSVHDRDAAVGELVFALRDVSARLEGGAPARPELATAGTGNVTVAAAPTPDASVVAIGQMLQSMGEFRHSVQAARDLIASGSRDLRVWRLAYPRAFDETVVQDAKASGVPAELVWSVMRQESAFSPIAVSRSNAQGLMQVVPSTWNWLAELQGDATPADPFDPEANIRYGTFYLGWLLRYFDGDSELAIAAYNRGQGYIRRLDQSAYVAGDRNELYREIDALETREYLQKVAVNLATYRALYPVDAEAVNAGGP